VSLLDPVRRLYDAHCHLHEFEDGEIEGFVENGYVILAVSDDLDSSRRTLELSKRYWLSVIPCLGIHPWNLEKEGLGRAREVIDLINRVKPRCVGEIGLDRRFLPESSFERQVMMLSMFLEAARSIEAVVNIHAIDAWRDALMMVERAGVERAIFHWYNGPDDVLKEIEDRGYMVSINAAIKIQEKHRKIAEKVNIDNMLIESDGPYNYRGLKLSPHMLTEAISIIASIKGVQEKAIMKAVERNFRKYLKL
jgi:TatD DNase family protein